MLHIFKKRDYHFDFMKGRRWAYALSIAMVVAAFAAFAARGLNYGIDFNGGVLIEAESASPVDMEALRGQLSGLDDLSIQSVGTAGRGVLIQTQPKADETAESVVAQIKTILGADYTYNQVEVLGPTIGQELKEKSLLASILALLAISIYIWFRFEWPFALGCLVSLAHDLIIVVGLFALFRIEFDMIVVAGLLSLAGYDCNDTIVTYDRIRENLKKFRKMPVDEILNKSLNETLSRTILTAVTTMFSVLVLLFVGGETLSGFSIALALGTIFGTYSSIYIAAPMLRMFDIRGLGTSAEPDFNKPLSTTRN
ncbi:MAG: protein translocase subunit SecF [Alphaproteobacteria bacterium]|nr:protein translocase subunit SecF [Alphaproteobacteria bacterium]